MTPTAFAACVLRQVEGGAGGPLVASVWRQVQLQHLCDVVGCHHGSRRGTSKCIGPWRCRSLPAVVGQSERCGGMSWAREHLAIAEGRLRGSIARFESEKASCCGWVGSGGWEARAICAAAAARVGCRRQEFGCGFPRWRVVRCGVCRARLWRACNGLPGLLLPLVAAVPAALYFARW